ncbi:MAG: Appr-1-p processing protein [Anaerolineae bacterium]|nr:Appr-1-p processing protein [Anaerolineae bacterium]
MSGIRYVTGSAAQPQGEGYKIIAHVCNSSGTWEPFGFARTLNRRWPRAQIAYKAWYKELGYRLALGTTQIVERRGEDIIIANMIARPGIKWLPVQPQPIDYRALEQCLQTVANRARYFAASVHLPRLDDWRKVERLVERTLVAGGALVFVYDGD